ncbi:MAG: hypothetical protein WDO15_06560 [Bacteroidota bacterium]
MRREEFDRNVFDCFERFVDLKKTYYSNKELQIVSFYDPNDPFGYKLPVLEGEMFKVINVRLNIAEYWHIDPRKATDFVVPKLKEKGAEAFLNLIDQADSTQNLMLNLVGPRQPGAQRL